MNHFEKGLRVDDVSLIAGDVIVPEEFANDEEQGVYVLDEQCITCAETQSSCVCDYPELLKVIETLTKSQRIALKAFVDVILCEAVENKENGPEST